MPFCCQSEAAGQLALLAPHWVINTAAVSAAPVLFCFAERDMQRELAICFQAARQGCLRSTLPSLCSTCSLEQLNKLLQDEVLPGSRQSSLSKTSASRACRIDHYLGKEMMQNMITMRFSNRFLSPMWNAQHISNVQVCDKSMFFGRMCERSRGPYAWPCCQAVSSNWQQCSCQGRSLSETSCVHGGLQPGLAPLEAGVLVAAPKHWEAAENVKLKVWRTAPCERAAPCRHSGILSGLLGEGHAVWVGPDLVS